MAAKIQMSSLAQALSGSAPSANEGLAADVSGNGVGNMCRAIVTLWATAAGNLTGGKLACWYKCPIAAQWVRLSDLDLTVAANTARGQTWFKDIPKGLTGRFLWIGSAVTLSAGTQIDIHTCLCGD